MAAVSIVGNWTLHYDWGSDGTYSTSPMTVAAGGTWSGGGYTGRWIQEEGMFMFTFNNSETTYAGNKASGSITGVMTTFLNGGLEGSFYMLKTGASLVAAAVAAKKPDASGKL